MGKAGRKKISGVKRTASGRRSRAADTYQENEDQIVVRMRRFGLTEPQARDQKAATVVGRLEMQRCLSSAQYDAAVRYLEIVEDYRRAIAAPDSTKQAGGSTSGPGETAAYAHWCAKAIAEREAARAAVATEQCIFKNRGANLFAALDYLVIRDESQLHMVGDLRIALNTLAHHFGIVRKVYARAEAA